ncbi:hypothetical protein Pan181_21800 [Aeoliella mucimassa]|uniref:Uncharacterized protein n=1 Tax=Aeoliella mucimassa TaxID=2527972 RepID=A0A518AMN1_9BACT|nr:hypothetical protein Pan181_21800 [Aeoliella mucimassa]
MSSRQFATGLLLLVIGVLATPATASSLHPSLPKDELPELSLETSLWLVNACAYRYVLGWESAYVDYCIEHGKYDDFRGDLDTPLLGGPCHFKRMAFQARGRSHAKISLRCVTPMVGSRQVMQTTSIAFAILGVSEGESATDLFWP